MTFVLPSISAAGTRLILLTAASALLLAAGDASTTASGPAGTAIDDRILAPMTPADASAANAALNAILPAGTAAAAIGEAVAADAIPAETAPIETAAAAPRDLSQLVDTVSADDATDGDLKCLATAVYFESRGEPLEGQLAVAQAIINRVDSGRYASSICGVVKQPGQFSFDHSRTPSKGSDWRIAKIIARIASAEMWRQVAPRAVSFHAARLSPRWRDKVRVARIGNHVFYR